MPVIFTEPVLGKRLICSLTSFVRFNYRDGVVLEGVMSGILVVMLVGFVWFVRSVLFLGAGIGICVRF